MLHPASASGKEGKSQGREGREGREGKGREGRQEGKEGRMDRGSHLLDVRLNMNQVRLGPCDAGNIFMAGYLRLPRAGARL